MENRLRVSVRQAGKEIVGTIESQGDALFMFEALATVVEAIGRKSGVAPEEVARDLYSFVAGKVTM